MGSGSTVALPSDDQFNRVSFLSHFDGTNNGVNNVFDDGSTSNHTITANGNVTQGSFGPFARPDGEWGVSFDGNGDSLTFTNDATMSLDGDYTFELFFNAVTIVVDSQQPAVFASATTQLYIHSSGRYISWFGPINGSSSGNIVHSASNSILTNVWNHVAIVRSGTGSNNTSMYLNGTRVQQYQNTQTLGAGSGTARIGSYSAAGGNFDGQISNLRILKGTALYSGSSITVPTAPLTAVSNTKLLTCQSNRFVDNSSTGFALTPVGNTAVTAFGAILTSSVYSAAVNGASAFIAARADGINIADSSEFNMTGEFSVEFWVYLISNDAEGIDIMFRGYGNGQNTQIGYEPSNRHLYLYNDANPVTSSTDMHINSWNHIACCRTSSTTSIFLNGVRVGTASYSTAVDWGGGTTQFMAYGDGAYSPAGYATDLRLLKGSSAYDATASTLTVPTAPLTAITNTKLLLNMADGQAIDSAAQNNLTLVGTAKTSTAQKKFGTASLLLDGNSDGAILNGDSFNVGSAGDFTIELFARFVAQQNYMALVTNWANGNNDWYWGYYAANDELRFYPGPKSFSFSASNDTWYHIALVRTAGNLKCFVDGTEIGSAQSDTTDVHHSPHILLGKHGSGEYFNGYMDEIRLSNMARYTSDFTAPSEPFADKGQ